MIVIRFLLLAGGAALTAAIFWAMQGETRPLGQILAEMTADKWTVVTFIDLYLGFFIAALIMILAERRWYWGLLWALPVFALGNVWTALWAIIRLPSLARRLRERA